MADISSSFQCSDIRWMRLALQYARRAEGRVAENPPVGCVLLDRQGRLIGASHTQKGGRPHAERNAIEHCYTRFGRDALRGGTAYVTLEPCSHTGKTPPCAAALLEAGITRAFIATGDPDPRVSGQGVHMLIEGGCRVETGLLRDEAEQIMCGFLMRQRQQRPYITSKIATSRDGFIAKTGQAPTPLTNAISQHVVHDLRSRSDALITGVSTLIADDPMLNVRLSGYASDTPLRVILDSQLRTPADSRIFTHQPEKILICHLAGASGQHLEQLRSTGAVLQEMPAAPDCQNRIDVHAVIRLLADMQINHVLLEAGAVLNHSFLTAELIDRIIWLKAPQELKSGLKMFSGVNQITSDMDFTLPSRYINSGSRHFAEDEMTVWQANG